VRLEAGSGFIVKAPSGKKYLLTNSHVCMVSRWKGTIKATYESGQIIVGKVIKDSLAADLCAIQVDQKLDALTLGASLRPRDGVCTRGYPVGVLTESCGVVGGMSLWQHMFPIEYLGECPADTTKQYHLGTGRLIGCLKAYTSTLTSLYARPGSSGSPVVNTEGELVGVVSDWQPGNDTEAGIVPIRTMLNFMGSL
jgi:S1-C subfamily serine protease